MTTIELTELSLIEVDKIMYKNKYNIIHIERQFFYREENFLATEFCSTYNNFFNHNFQSVFLNFY